MKKRTTFIAILATCMITMFAFTSCGLVKNACKHTYDNACDITCNDCGEERTTSHNWLDADCDTPKTCSVCGATEGEVLGHTPEDDDGDCTTAITCSVCGTVTTPARENHTGGTSTCLGYQCDVCGKWYGDKTPDNHASEEFAYTVNEDVYTHRKAHKCCDVTVIEAEAHDFVFETGKCKLCDAQAAVELRNYFEDITFGYYFTMEDAFENIPDDGWPYAVYAITDYDADFTIPVNLINFFGESYRSVVIGTVLLNFNGTVINESDISGGVFNGKVINQGDISGGIYTILNGEVINEGTVWSGTFNGEVINKDLIRGGTFNGEVTNTGSIIQGTFNGCIINNGHISNEQKAGAFTLGENFSIVNNGTIDCKYHIYKDGVCRLCAYECDHSGTAHTTATDNGDGTHGFTCTVCGGYGTEDHKGGEATCAAQAVCAACGTSYGDLAPENHDFGSGNTCICGAEIAFTGIDVDDERSDEYRYDETSNTYTIIIPADEVGGTGYLSCDIIGTNLTLIEDTNTLLKVQHEDEFGPYLPPDGLLVDMLQNYGYFGWSVSYGDGEWEKLSYSNDGGMTWTTYTFEVKQAYSITVNASQNGTVTANEYAIEGDNIALNVSPAEGYMLDTLSVTDASGNTIVVENNQFTMPASAVTVNATFAVCDHKDSRHETATDNDDGTHSFTCTVCGVTGTENHTLTYTANGNIITESCSADCGYSETATISATDATYNGLEHNTATVDYSEGWKGGTLTISYANHMNAGTATASITIGEATASVDFTIAKATVTVTADAKIKSYGDENPTLTYTAEGLLGDDTLTGALTGTLSREEGENVGSYAITLGTLSADNYTISFEGADFTIQAKEVTEPIVTLDQTSYQYDGNVKEPKVTSIVVDGRTLTEGIDYTVSYEDNVYVNTEAKVVINFMGNYDGTFKKYFTITQDPDTTEFDGEWVTVPKE